MNFIGLDIGTSSIKAVELTGGKKPQLMVFADASMPAVTLASESEEDLKTIASSLDKFISESGFTTRDVVVALPESQVFTRVVPMPEMTEKELSGAVEWEAGQYIPVPLDEVYVSHQILKDHRVQKNDGSKGKVNVLLIAAPKIVVDKYVRTLKYAGLEAIAVETETTAVARSLVGSTAQQYPTLLINIGASTTDLAIVSGGDLRFTRSISTGGTALARAISQSLGFEFQQAEEYKKTYGLEESHLEGKVMEAIKPVFDILINEIKRSIAFYVSHYEDKALKNVILCGGTASLPGIIVYLAAILDLEVQLGNPWQEIIIPETFDTQELEEAGPRFAVATGLALKKI